MNASLHLERCAARESEKQDPLGICAIEHEVRDAMCKRAGLASTGAGDDQKRRAGNASPGSTVARGRALAWIQAGEMRGNGGVGGGFNVVHAALNRNRTIVRKGQRWRWLGSERRWCITARRTT